VNGNQNKLQKMGGGYPDPPLGLEEGVRDPPLPFPYNPARGGAHAASVAAIRGGGFDLPGPLASKPRALSPPPMSSSQGQPDRFTDQFKDRGG